MQDEDYHPRNRDGLKTIIGLIIVAAIVIATFMYGNYARKHPEAVTAPTPSPSPCEYYANYTIDTVPARCLSHFMK